MAGALQAAKPARQTEADSDDVSGSESGSDDQSDDEPAAPVRPEPVAVKPKLAPAAKPAPAPAAKAPPKGVRARLQQSAAEAAAKQQAAAEEQLAAAPVAVAGSPAAPDAVTAELQSAVRQSDPRLALSASPTLPDELVDPDANFSHVAFDTAPSYTNSDAAAVSALNAGSADFEHGQPDSTGRDESAIEPDFFAAPATAPAEEPAAVAAGVKTTRGIAPACSYF